MRINILLSLLLNSAFIDGATRSKKFKLIYIKPDAWKKLTELKEARSEELCRNACVKAENECHAYFFNSLSNMCEFEDFSGSTDPILLHKDHGKTI